MTRLPLPDGPAADLPRRPSYYETTPRPLYAALAAELAAWRHNVARVDRAAFRADWAQRRAARIEAATREFLPSGGGFDAGTEFDFDAAEGTLRFRTSFHHMNEGGFYEGWTAHVVRVRPSLHLGFLLTVSGPNRAGITDYIAEGFDVALRRPTVLAPDGAILPAPITPEKD